MRPNPAKQRLQAGLPTLGATVTCASPLVAETMGHLGYDWVLIDLQHGENNLGNLAAMLTAVSATPTVPWVRVVSDDGPLIQRVLDLGAYGVVVPLVNNAREAEAAVRAMRYPPRGERSWGPIRGSLYGGADYHAAAERELQLIVMIETAEGIRNADEIFAVDGVDGCLIGTNDFTMSFGLPPRPVPDTTSMDPRVEEAVRQVLAAARRHGKAPGIFTTDDGMASERVRQGFRVISLLGDVGGMRAGCSAMLRSVRTTAEQVGG
ncbi:MAG: 2,4-dihydroxyhept-2-ene-1,7-dioic acid aldolase [Chloroflexi bacterium]|nr:2,4-dihydroxyhept-2-ene-1,7-dioic acid aldolase [Chloroflexota bacterium]